MVVLTCVTCGCSYDITKALGLSRYKVIVNFEFRWGKWIPLNVIRKYVDNMGRPRSTLHVFVNKPRLFTKTNKTNPFSLKNFLSKNEVGECPMEKYYAFKVLNIREEDDMFHGGPSIPVTFRMSGVNLVCGYDSTVVVINPDRHTVDDLS